MRTLIGALALAFGATAAEAITDDLQCYKITNTNLRFLKGVVDLDAPTMGLAPDCKLSKASLYCVPASSTIEPGTLLDGRVPIVPLEFGTVPAETARICYEVTCKAPAGTSSAETATDQFGTHHFTHLTTKMICKPAVRGTLPPPVRGFQIVTPDIEIQAGQEITYCYYFRTPNTETVAVKRWTSEMTSVNHHALVFTTPSGEAQPPGTLTTNQCGVLSGGNKPIWVYDAHTPSAELALPPDDGGGKPLAFVLAPNTPAFILMHHINATSQTQKARVVLNAEALDAGVAFTKTTTYLSDNLDINIPPTGTGVIESMSCPVPAGLKFWRLTTYAHKQAVLTRVLDGSTALFSSTDWEHPGAALRTGPPFLAFSSNQLTSECTYDNPSFRTIHHGNSQLTDEECVAVGYFFPADAPLFCAFGMLF